MPLFAYGYIRVAADPPEGSRTEDLLSILSEYAENNGYVLAEVFTEWEDSGSSAFAALIETLEISEQPIVIVPALGHFAHFPGLRAAMKERIERETGARIVIITSNDLE